MIEFQINKIAAKYISVSRVSGYGVMLSGINP